jgi:hypothetical protein
MGNDRISAAAGDRGTADGVTRRYRYRHEMTVPAPSERAARVLAAQGLPASDGWPLADTGEFALVRASGGRYTLSLAVTFRAADRHAARRLVAALFGPPLARGGLDLRAVGG